MHQNTQLIMQTCSKWLYKHDCIFRNHLSCVYFKNQFQEQKQTVISIYVVSEGVDAW